MVGVRCGPWSGIGSIEIEEVDLVKVIVERSIYSKVL